MRCLLTSLVTFGLLASHVQPVQAHCYTFRTIDILTSGGTIGTTSLLDVNNKREIVGVLLTLLPLTAFWSIVRARSPQSTFQHVVALSTASIISER
jgi:hypothetical protein